MEPQESEKKGKERMVAKSPEPGSAPIRKKLFPIGRFLETWDWIWALPLTIFLYWGFGYFFGAIMGMSIGNFDLSFVQPLFLAITVVHGASVASIYILRFHWKGLYRFIYSTKIEDENISSIAAFKLLQPWQKIFLVAFFYFFYVGAVVAVYLTIL